ncbi:hypothetical protein GSU68_03155 [Rathayibacter sp. VKM Ac-2759]|uniref:hypothetical protein n=1 Tax=Rathayibacter sp. VKM Ac-2759 TaxID=2609252 RepID=UPI0013165E03|nr:hypothetical protein [Rathayibacter sp. VKM Ac-2759]QHC65675.1 hypothetical protein GSU68_03155 [Rathayibacter sp. VKM Ac-2759]
MKTLSHTGGSLVLEDETASAVVRYSMALAQQREMSTVTLEDAGTPAPHSQVLLVVGHGVPLSVRTARGVAGASVGSECGGDLDVRTAALTAPHRPVTASPEDARQDDAASDLYFDLL